MTRPPTTELRPPNLGLQWAEKVEARPALDAEAVVALLCRKATDAKEGICVASVIKKHDLRKTTLK